MVNFIYMKKISPTFYYHYKHDPQKGFDNHAYEVIGVGWDTESNVLSVIYRPLYKNTYLKADYCVRPYKMFIEDVEVEGKRIKRFKKITNAKIITKLKKIRKEMYLMK